MHVHVRSQAACAPTLKIKVCLEMCIAAALAASMAAHRRGRFVAGLSPSSFIQHKPLTVSASRPTFLLIR